MIAVVSEQGRAFPGHPCCNRKFYQPVPEPNEIMGSNSLCKNSACFLRKLSDKNKEYKNEGEIFQWPI
jgi:hypothetical protein